MGELLNVIPPHEGHTDGDPTEIDLIIQQMKWDTFKDKATYGGSTHPCSPSDYFNLDDNLHLLNSASDSSTKLSLRSTWGSAMGSMIASPVATDCNIPLFDTSQTYHDAQVMFPDFLGLSTDASFEWSMDDPQTDGLSGWIGSTMLGHGSECFNNEFYSSHQPQATLMDWPELYTKVQTEVAEIPLFSDTTQASDPMFNCSHCHASFADRTKFKIHTNKHTKPFKCAAARCDYATAEKKSLQRHLLAKSRWDEEHRLAAQGQGVKGVKYQCPKQGCTYSTIREDNLKRHMSKCCPSS